MRRQLALIGLVVASTAHAQTQIRPRVILMVDTSGSMTEHFTDNNSTGGDGSTFFRDSLMTRQVSADHNLSLYVGFDTNPLNTCPAPNNEVFDGSNSRLAGAKSAVNNVLNASGDIDWGLMRYSGTQCPVLTHTFAIDAGSTPTIPEPPGRCTQNSDCPSGTCDTTVDRCTCTTAAQCGGAACNANRCRGTAAGQCTAAGFVRNAGTNDCVCNADAQCGQGVCDTNTGLCNCLNTAANVTSCNLVDACNTATRTCACSTATCGRACNAGRCPCTTDADCAAEFCVGGFCGTYPDFFPQGCNVNGDCGTGQTCTGRKCTCATDDNCRYIALGGGSSYTQFCAAGGFCGYDNNHCFISADYAFTDRRNNQACGNHFLETATTGLFTGVSFGGSCGTAALATDAACETKQVCAVNADCGSGNCVLGANGVGECGCTTAAQCKNYNTTDAGADYACTAGRCVYNVACSKAGGFMLVDPSLPGYSTAQITPYIDGVEDETTGNPELRASGGTPLASAARFASTWYGAIRDYSTTHPACLAGTDANPLCDSKIACRPYVLVQMTDGLDTCDGGDDNEGPAAAAAGFVDATASVARQANKVYIIGLAFGGTSSPALDAIAKAGGSVNARYANSPADIQGALADIVASSVLVEKCNNADDDCNGACDEPFPDVAVTGAGCTNPRTAKSCDNGALPGTKCFATGTYVCAPGGLSETCSAQTCATNPALCATGETCNGQDDDCNGVIDDCTPFVPGSCCTSSCPACNTAGVPQAETCNGCDDDCDGTIDNHLVDTGFACGVAVGICTAGTTACCQEAMPAVGSCTTGSVADRLVCLGGTGPKAETCNATDDDCDGIKDDNIAMNGQPCTGAGVNTTGICKAAYTCTGVAGSGPNGLTCVQTVGPAAETCNGLDDDCDGTPDDHLTEPWPGTACCPSSTGALTDCCTTGTWQCVAGAKTCLGATVKGVEICNGLDDDCDGTVDDNIVGDNAPCSGAGIFTLGECKAQYECTGSPGPGPNGLTCVQLVGPTVELCNGLDDDCDGTPDDNLADPRVGVVGGAPCLPLVPLSGTSFPGGVAQPPCNPGTTVCVAGAVQCTGEVFPQPNQCDGISIDCTGMVNTNGNCGTGFQCYQGTCATPCGNGEFPCPGGFVCINTTATDPGICVPDICVTMPCPTGLLCQIDNNGNRACVDPCAHVDCPTGFRCQSGACVDDTCRTFGCPTGQICTGTPPTCQANPCAGVTCPPTQYCDGTGACVSECVEGQCASNEVCVDGTCSPDPCANLHCAVGQVCVVSGGVGMCADNLCGSGCSSGSICCGGQCQTNPCLALQCPTGSSCVVRDTCAAACEVPAPPAQVQIVPAGGGGFSCDIAGPGARPSGALVLVALLLVAFLSRRRSSPTEGAL